MAGRRFRWRGYYSDFYLPTPTTLLVRDEAQPYRTFRVIWPIHRAPQILPNGVRVCIERAIELGWPQEHRMLELDGTGITLVTYADGTRL